MNPLNQRSTSCFLEVEEETVELLPLQRLQSCIIFGLAKTTGSFPVSSELQRPTTLDETWCNFTFYYDWIASRPSFSRDIYHLPSDKIDLLKRNSTFPLHCAISIYIRILSIASSDVEIQVNRETVLLKCF